MQHDERRLVRHLAWLVVIKLAALGGLWWGFVHTHGVRPDAAATASHLTQDASTAGGTR